jgi:hypothetical protein
MLMVTVIGYRVAGTLAFKDHHRFDAHDVDRIREEAEACRATATRSSSFRRASLVNPSSRKTIEIETAIGYELPPWFPDKE